MKNYNNIKRIIEKLIPDSFELQAMFLYSIIDNLCDIRETNTGRTFLIMRIDLYADKESLLTSISEYVSIIKVSIIEMFLYSIEVKELEEE